MIERIVIAVVALLALFFGGAMFLPSTAQLERSVEIERPVGTVFALIERFDTFPAWSPLSVRDPGISYSISGPGAGPGARLEWVGDPRLVGSGGIEITESRANSRVDHDIQIDPRREATSTMRIERIAGGSRVTWQLDIDLAGGEGFFGRVLSRYFGVVFERWIGPDFEQALEGLKRHAESLPGADFSGLEVTLLQIEAVDMLYVDMSGGAGVAARLGDAYSDISAFMAARGVERSGQPISLKRRNEAGRYRYEAAIPVVRIDVPAEEPVRWGRTPAGRALKVEHRGDYGQLEVTYQKLASWMAAHGIVHGGVSWEQYVSDPATIPEAKRITHIYVLLAPPR